MNSPNFSLQLKAALATWPRWEVGLAEPPVVERELPGGLSNRSWVVKTSVGKAVVRINSAKDQLFNVDRKREQIILERLSRERYSAAVWFCDPELGVLVREFIDGETLTEAERADPCIQQQVLLILDDLRNISLPQLPTFDYWNHLSLYRQQLTNQEIRIPDQLEDLFFLHRSGIRKFQQSSWQPVLVHHDLTPANIINKNGCLVIIDWEYAAMGYAGMDKDLWSESEDPFGKTLAAYRQLVNGYWFLLNAALS